MNNELKKLYLVATPIGNLEDITYRAVRILSEADVVLCEDTRVTGKLLAHYGIKAKMESYHAHSSAAKEADIIKRITEGVTFALVSDAGTPTISDPGVKLVHEAYAALGDYLDVIAIPGPAAVITALSSSGFMGNQFSFYGFIPHKKGRKTLFEKMLSSDQISVVYESPHRIMKTLEYLAEHAPDRMICVARELTKMYEQKKRGPAQQVYNYFLENSDKIRGEFVLLIDKV